MDVQPLKPDDYYEATRHTQIVSVDLILYNSRNEVLVGKRKNAPARGYWFVPGGRVFKFESIRDSVGRISKREVGTKILVSNLEFIGVYDHIYPDNFRDCNHSTHYLAHGFRTIVHQHDISPEIFSNEHSELKWMNVADLLTDENVHEYTKNYFRPGKRSY